MRFRNDQERYEWTVELTSDLLSTMAELRLDDTPEPDEMKVVRFVEQLALRSRRRMGRTASIRSG